MSFRNSRSEPKEILGLNRITKKRLLELCRKDRLYQTPALNDVLYLHFQGFQCIECLEEYTELKCLWLESNALSEIQGLENQHKLKCLFLQSNLIKKIENLEFCKELDTINLSQNQLRKIENVNSDILPVLNTLNLASNYITDSDGLRELENCKSLSVVDLSNNRIHDILIVKIFAKMPELKVLILQGNPVVSKIPQYRKTLILECKNLTYLDSRPVFPKDRACAEAWKRGGYQEERKENERWNRKDRRKIRDSVNATIRMRNRNRKPEDQLTILVSSDSEDEIAARERRRQHQDLDAGVSMEIGIWDEVDKNLDHKSESASSSDMNVSSSTSVISTTDSNAETSNGSCKEDEEEKILNSVENMSKEIIVDLLGQEQFRESYTKEHDINQSLTAEMQDLPPESPNEIQQIGSLKKSKKTEAHIEEADDKPIEQIPGNNLNQNDGESESQEQSQILPSIEVSAECRSSDESDEPKESYDPTIEAIHRATMNNLSDVDASPKTFERRVFLQIETNEDNYEPIIEMEEAMNTMTAKADAKRESPKTLNDMTVEKELNTSKIQTQFETEDKFSKINEEATKNFEKISSNMDIAMAQFQKDQEERQRVFAALFSQEEAPKESSSEESYDENEINMENKRIERMVDQWDRQTRLKGGKKRNVISASFNTSQQIDMWTESSGQRDNIKISTSMTTKTDFNFYELPQSPNENEKSAEDPSRIIKSHLGRKQDVEIGTTRSRTGSGDGLEIIEDSDNHVIGHKRDIPDEIANRSFVEKNKNSDCRENKDEDANAANYNTEKIVGNEDEPDQITNIGDVGEHFEKYEDKGHINVEAANKIQAATANREETETVGVTKTFGNTKIQAATANLEGTETVGVKQTFANSLKVDNPIDATSLTLETNEALKSFEKETKYLKELLQKLEDDNERLYKVLGNEENYQVNQERESNEVVAELKQENNLESPETIAENTREENTIKHKENHIEDVRHIERAEESENVEKYEEEESGSDTPPEENVGEDQNEVICVQIVSDMVQALDLKPQKPLSYEFPEDLETDEESEPRKELTYSNTIREVIDSFTGIFDQKSPEGYTYRFGDEKTSILKHLANSPNLKQFNQDTHESLDKQLAVYELEQSNTVRGIVDRVYAQKDRYDDTIELIDGKLMVVHKDTGELSALPPSRFNPNSDESDGHYDTAESDLEDGAGCIKPLRTNCGINNKPRGWSHDGWRSFASASSDGFSKENGDSCSKTQADSHVNVWPRRWGPFSKDDYKPSEARMRDALGAPKYNEESDDESNFYSMDDQKPETVYGRIGNEICDSMTFDHINILSDEDENHIVQCSRSYEELREILKAEKEERRVTAEENALLEKMVEGKYTRGVERPLMDSAEMRLEDDQLRILMERNREYSARDIRGAKLSQSETNIYKPARDHIKILEYNPYSSMEESNAYANNLAETRDTISVESDCAEIYGNDIFSYVHCEELESKKDEAEQFVHNVLNWKKYECVNYKEIKETLNRKEKQLDYEDEEIESLKTNRCSESEKNEIELNVDIECQMEETKREIECEQEKIINIDNNSCQESSRSSTFFDDLQNIANNLEEIADFHLDSNASEELTHQLNDILGRLELLPNLNKASEDINRQATEDINRNPDEATIQSSLDNIENLSKIEEFERIDGYHKEECLMYQTDKNNSQQSANLTELPSCSPYAKVSLETFEDISSAYQNVILCSELKTELHDEKMQEAVILDSVLQGEDEECTSVNLTVHDDPKNANETRPIKQITDDGWSTEELPDCKTQTTINEPPLEKELPDVEYRSFINTVEVDTLACNLEVLGCNDEVIDTITVNAEIHYEN